MSAASGGELLLLLLLLFLSASVPSEVLLLFLGLANTWLDKSDIYKANFEDCMLLEALSQGPFGRKKREKNVYRKRHVLTTDINTCLYMWY